VSISSESRSLHELHLPSDCTKLAIRPTMTYGHENGGRQLLVQIRPLRARDRPVSPRSNLARCVLEVITHTDCDADMRWRRRWRGVAEQHLVLVQCLRETERDAVRRWSWSPALTVGGDRVVHCAIRWSSSSSWAGCVRVEVEATSRRVAQLLPSPLLVQPISLRPRHSYAPNVSVRQDSTANALSHAQPPPSFLSPATSTRLACSNLHRLPSLPFHS
jgi:hypothetical protein